MLPVVLIIVSVVKSESDVGYSPWVCVAEVDTEAGVPEVVVTFAVILIVELEAVSVESGL